MFGRALPDLSFMEFEYLMAYLAVGTLQSLFFGRSSLSFNGVSASFRRNAYFETLKFKTKFLLGIWGGYSLIANEK